MFNMNCLKTQKKLNKLHSFLYCLRVFTSSHLTVSCKIICYKIANMLRSKNFSFQCVFLLLMVTSVHIYNLFSSILKISVNCIFSGFFQYLRAFTDNTYYSNDYWQIFPDVFFSFNNSYGVYHYKYISYILYVFTFGAVITEVFNIEADMSC